MSYLEQNGKEKNKDVQIKEKENYLYLQTTLKKSVDFSHTQKNCFHQYSLSKVPRYKTNI